MNHVQRVIKQVDELYQKNDNIMDWNALGDDLFAELSRSDIMLKYSLNAFQYKTLKKYMVGK